ncbi:MAG TPA: hypothetical protein VFQ33_14910, partial [Xanthobacteraceae bacterium]|nr:hypothetical protein [Xanthobacteraceae bacterium]
TDGRTIQGSKIESSHGITSLLSEMQMVRPSGPNRFAFAQPEEACASPDMGADPARRKGANRLGP